MNVSRFALFMAAMFVAGGVALADKPSWAGGGKHGKSEQSEERYSGHQEAGAAYHFNDATRRIIGEYYGKQVRAGKCPPGLAKKNNGCLPPGQAKKWAKGHTLPADLRYHDLPYDLLRRLPPPPPRHRYVQIAEDILMIATGSNMVIDAVEDILR